MKHEDEREYAWMFRAHFPAVVRTVFFILHDRGRAEEVAQEAFVKLFQNSRTVSRYERPEAWVRRVAIRMALRQSRRDSLRTVLERRRESDTTWEDRLPDIDLARALRALAPMQRAAVALYYFDDQPVAEIAHVLQVSESTVKQHLLRARRRLAELLHEEVTEDAH